MCIKHRKKQKILLFKKRLKKRRKKGKKVIDKERKVCYDSEALAASKSARDFQLIK